MKRITLIFVIMLTFTGYSKPFAIKKDVLSNLPLCFVENRGQVNSRVLYYSMQKNYTLWVTGNGLVFDYTIKGKKRKVVSIDFYQHGAKACVKGDMKMNGVINYFRGKSKDKWITGVPAYREVTYEEIFKGINLKVYGNHKEIEFDFIVKPGASIKNVYFSIKGGKSTIDKNGDVLIKNDDFQIKIHRPIAYQLNKNNIPVSFIQMKDGRFGLEVGNYDKTKTLVVDPLITPVSGYIGGTSDETGCSIFSDGDGYIYLAGYTYSTDFPLSNSVQGANAGGADVFISKFSPDGTDLIFSTYVGGSGDDFLSKAILLNGYILCGGTTDSTDFPVVNAYQGSNAGHRDCFLFVLKTNGNALIDSSYFGGTGDDFCTSIAVNNYGVYVTGYTYSTDFPVKNAFQSSNAGPSDAFVSRFSVTERFNLVYSTYLGGSDGDYANAIVVNDSNEVYIAGRTKSSDFPLKNPYQSSLSGYNDMFISHLTADGSSLISSTYLGGSGYDTCNGLFLWKQRLYFVGSSDSVNFPVVNAYQPSKAGSVDMVFGWFDLNLSTLEYSSYFGGTNNDFGNSIFVDENSLLYLAGQTLSSEFPVKRALQSSLKGTKDGFLTCFKSSRPGVPLYFSTYIGGTGEDNLESVFSKDSKVFVAGSSKSSDFPINNAYQGSNKGGQDAILTELEVSTDISVHISFDNNHPVKGDNINITVNVENNDVFDVKTVRFLLSLSDNLEILSHTATYGTFYPSTYVWSMSDLYSGNTATLTITAKVREDGDIFASVSMLDCSPFDSNNSNNYSEANGVTVHTIHATSGEHGIIQPSGDVIVEHGGSITFSFIPDAGYHVDKLTVDGQDIELSDHYTFENVVKNHTINVEFSENMPPVIQSFKVELNAGSSPFQVHATVDAYDPDGGDIKTYLWHFTGERDLSVSTEVPEMSYTLVMPGTYNLDVTVIDDEGEETTSEPKTITVEQSLPVALPLPVKEKFAEVLNGVNNVETCFVNVFNSDISLVVDAYDSNGNVVKEITRTLSPYGTYTLKSGDIDVDYTKLFVHTDKYILIFQKVNGEGYETESYLNTHLKSKLYIPHIAEERDYWSSVAFVSNPANYDIKCEIAGTTYDKGDDGCLYLDLEEMMPEDVNVETNWGSITPSLSNPFSDPKKLTGFEIFVKNNLDGGAIEMNISPSRTLYIPHIPEETYHFWTGLVINNVEGQDANIEIDFYTADGEYVGNYQFTLNAGSKFKTLIKDIIPETDKKICYAIVNSNRKIIGAELFGTVDKDAICGYALSQRPETWGVVPDILNDETYWTGIAFLNVSSSNCMLTLTLRDADGNVKSEKQIEINGKHRWKAVVSDVFGNDMVENGDTITYVSSKPVVGLKVSGDYDNNVMSALSSTR